MEVKRKPVAYEDLRGWVAALDKAGELDQVKGEVDWKYELGTLTRLALGPGTGKALMFNNIKDYNKPDSRCGRMFVSGLASYSRVAMMMGLPRDTHPRELVKLGRSVLEGRIAPRTVKEAPCKEVIVKGKDVNLDDFPSPIWNRPDGGRYILTYAGIISKDPTTHVHNIGIYRGMAASKNEIPMLMWRAQNVGHHVAAWQAQGHKRMPIAVAIGCEPTFGFCASAPITRGVCEYDVMGAIRGAPIDLVKCETNDLMVPASAEIIIEGELTLDPAEYVMEGPFAEFTGYVAGDKSLKPCIKITCITHRKNPILTGAIEGALPGSYSENGICSSIMRAGVAWNVLDRAGVPGIVDVWCPPVQMGINTTVAIKQSYRNQAKQVGHALWGSAAGHVRYKHVTVVDDDIDIHDYGAVDWAIAYRVNAGEDDVLIAPSTFGAGLDPSTRKRDRNAAQFGTGKWARVLIDATMNLDYDPDPELDGARFPPLIWPSDEDRKAAHARWKELGLTPLDPRARR